MEGEGLNSSQLMREDSSSSHKIEDITGRVLPYEVDWEAPQLLPHDELELPVDEDITGRLLPPQTHYLPPASVTAPLTTTRPCTLCTALLAQSERLFPAASALLQCW